MSIPVGGGSWQLAILPDYHSDQLLTNLFTLRALVFFSAAVIMLLLQIRFRQIKEKYRLEYAMYRSQQLLEKVGHVAQIGGWKIDAQLNIVQWSEQISRLLSTATIPEPRDVNELVAYLQPPQLGLLREAITKLFNDKNSFDLELEIHDSIGDGRWLRFIGEYVQEDEQPLCMGTVQDITDKVQSMRVIERQATFDALTGLPNRLLFSAHLRKALDSARRRNEMLAVLFIDLDRFKPVNDNHGHAVGDELLRQVAQRISSCVRESDTVARLSGDEFGVLLSHVEEECDIQTVIEKVIEAVQLPLELGNVRINCSCSIGVAIYPQDGRDEQTLIIHADQAMYEVKNSGRNGWQFYTRELQQKSEQRHAMLQALILAINENKLSCHYQPIIDIHSGQVVRCEALARWQRNDGSYVPPYEFITLAEESGLINRIDTLMLENACEQLLASFPDGDIGLSINVSPRLFHSKDHALELWLEKISRYSQNIEITVEITERLITANTDKALGVLSELKEMGVKIAIDDFGTGYSSLGYLVRFPVDIIKIDIEFISKLGRDEGAETLVETILGMADKLGMACVAEGIELSEQLTFLKAQGCQFGQGFYLAKPMPLESFQQFVQQANQRSDTN
ncbi:putative bifunctional diguanylate cyclase/phosphodiesterase [Pseudobowmanella zhangzhouensis]|uniref:putative bifunctional diguanylate cyclase/phosphodiesterase n=1 Tax=Pseudobowmanella zhangzhouensis TaxID=1537679 RepID=UPI003618D5C7